MRVLSREEQTRFVSYLLDDMDTCKFGVLLTLFTGVRIGELCALQWGNISLKEQTIRIDATLQRLRDTSAAGSTRTRIVIGTPKSDTSIRTIPITDYTAELCGKMNPHSSAAYVLTGTENYMEPRALQYRMEKYTRECGLEGVHFTRFVTRLRRVLSRLDLRSSRFRRCWDTRQRLSRLIGMSTLL